jgi:hypothetical protein
METTMMWKTILPLVAAGLMLPALAPADEVDELVRKLDAPERFADHKPQWKVEKKAFDFEHVKGPITWHFYMIRDGDRTVAVMPMEGFHSGTIYVQDFRPGHAPKEVPMPTERWHIDTAIGSEIRTDQYIPVKEGQTDATYDFKVDGEKLILTRRYEGTATISKWAHKVKKREETIDVTNTFVFRVDAKLGYVVDGTYDTRVKPRPPAVECASLATSGRYSLWPGTETCYRVASSPVGEKKYAGYYLNLAAIGAAGGSFTCRDGGFVAFLDDKSGWSPAMTLEGGKAKLVVCNAHADQDFVVRWPKDSKPDEDGFHHYVVKQRLLALPPEVTKYVWDKMDVAHEGRKKVQIRVGGTEDFEDQPLPYTTRVRGLTFTGRGPEISTEHARSGERSMVVKGRVWPNLPQLNLQPNTKYRLEAYFRVEPWSEEQKAAAIEKAKKRIAKQRKKGKEVEDFAGLDEPEAFIQADFYEWSPYSGKMLVKNRTTAAKPGKDGWRKVAVEFTTPKWGPFVNISFVARNCNAWMDDFTFVPVEE